ncbi:MAG: hypothetical protein ACFE9S_19640, partial [Candidatus Hermodarchaeota archaeon]
MKFLKTISVEEFRQILNSIQKVETGEELVNLDDSFNRIISKDIISSINVPHFRKSRMDGYAVIAEDTFGAEEDNIIELEVVDIIQAGDIPQKKLSQGQCSYVATGAAIPENSNAVLMVEFTEKRDNKVFISNAVSPGTHVIAIGHDVKKGDIIV